MLKKSKFQKGIEPRTSRFAGKHATSLPHSHAGSAGNKVFDPPFNSL